MANLSNNEVPLYEIYPGSRYEQPPFSNSGPADDQNPDSMIQIRDGLMQAVAESVKAGFETSIPPVVSVDNRELLDAFTEMRGNLTREIPASINAAFQAYTPPAVVNNNQELLNAFNELRVDLTRDIATNIRVGVKDALVSLTQKLDSFERSMNGQNVNTFESLNDVSDSPSQSSNPQMVGSTNESRANAPSAVGLNNVPVNVSVPTNETSAAQKSADIQHTTSDDELLDVPLPDGSVSVSQILQELGSQVSKHSQFKCPIRSNPLFPQVNRENIGKPSAVVETQEMEVQLPSGDLPVAITNVSMVVNIITIKGQPYDFKSFQVESTSTNPAGEADRIVNNPIVDLTSPSDVGSKSRKAKENNPFGSRKYMGKKWIKPITVKAMELTFHKLNYRSKSVKILSSTLEQ